MLKFECSDTLWPNRLWEAQAIYVISLATARQNVLSETNQAQLTDCLTYVPKVPLNLEGGEGMEMKALNIKIESLLFRLKRCPFSHSRLDTHVVGVRRSLKGGLVVMCTTRTNKTMIRHHFSLGEGGVSKECRPRSE